MNAQRKLVGFWLLGWLGLGLFTPSGFGEEAKGVGAQTVPSRRVVVFGDSITAGYGLERSEAFPAVLQRKIEQENLPFEIVGAGVSGDTTAGGLRRIAWVLGPGAAVCVVALGGNDGLRGIPPEETAANLSGIIRLIRSKCPVAVVILAGMRMPDNYGTPYTQAFEALFPRVAAENGTPLVPFLLEGVGGIPAMNQADLIHPTAEGQVKVAENVWKVLHPLLVSLKQEK
jgi:acyl-CoA thioesterase I